MARDMMPRGRMSSYAFFVQKTREDLRKKHPTENVAFTEFSKQCAESWKKMDDSEKKKYVLMAEEDKKRFNSEMEFFVPAEDRGKKRKKKKTKRDPKAPKRALTSFFWFFNEERFRAKARLPDGSSGADVAKECARFWNRLGAVDRSQYEALAARGKERYIKETISYRQMQKVKKYKMPLPKVKFGRRALTSPESDG